LALPVFVGLEGSVLRLLLTSARTSWVTPIALPFRQALLTGTLADLPE